MGNSRTAMDDTSGMTGQSPVALPAIEDVDAPAKTSLSKFALETKPLAATIVNKANTVRVDVAAGSFLMVEGRTYEMVQFHFHTPAEHTVGGHRHALELHLVHSAVEGNSGGPPLAVVAVLFQLGEEPNPFVQRVFDHIPEEMTEEDEPRVLVDNVSFDGVNFGGTCFRYSGSLTTPPYSENVLWCVQHEVHTVTAAQVAMFDTFVPFDNYRPLQELDGRLIHVCNCAHTDMVAVQRDENEEEPVSRGTAKRLSRNISFALRSARRATLPMDV